MFIVISATVEVHSQDRIPGTQIARKGRSSCPTQPVALRGGTPARTLIRKVDGPTIPLMARFHEDPIKERSASPSTRRQPTEPMAEGEKALGTPSAMVESLQRSAGNAAVGAFLTPREPAPRPTGGGEPVPSTIRGAAERKLGADLADVRLHSDGAARQYAEGLHAEAVTVGRDVYLARTGGDFRASDARQTLVHELVHAVQESGDSTVGPRRVSRATSGPEVEARQIAAQGFDGAPAAPSHAAPGGVAYRIAEEDEEPQADAEQAPKPGRLAEQLLNPESDGTGPEGPAPGTSGEAEAVAYEVGVMQPLRAVLAAAEQQDWEAAMAQLKAVGQRLLDYQVAYEKRDPMLATRLMSARGWLSVAYQQLSRRLDMGVWTDEAITDHFRDDVGEFERIEALLH